MRIDVKNQSITVTEFKQMVSGSVGQYVSEISFSSEWATYDRFIVFASVDMSRKTILTIATGQTSVVIPWEILDKPGLIRIGAYGLRGTDARPTVWSNPIMIATGLYPPDLSDPEDFGKPPTMLPWEELARRIGELSNLDTEDKSNLVAAINELFEHSVGTMHHNELMNRDAPDQHPISAIEGLDEALAEKADAEDIPEKTSDLTNDSGFITEGDIPSIPAALSDLSEDSGHRTVTDAEKEAWNAKQPAGDYALNSAVTAEAAVRQAADVALQTQIDSLGNVAHLDGNEIVTGNKTFEQKTVGSILIPANPNSGTVGGALRGIKLNEILSTKETTYDISGIHVKQPMAGKDYTLDFDSIRSSMAKADSALQEHQSLAAYRTSADQDVIDAGKESKGKITISGVEKTANTHTVTIVTNGVTTNMTLVGVS